MDGIDSHIFTAMGYHITEGQQLYVDVWESKPLNIYLINALALEVLGVQYSSIWLLQLLNGLLIIFLFYKLVELLTKDFHLAVISTGFFMWLFYFSGLYYSGNCTEEYGLTCLLLGVYAAIRGMGSSKNSWFYLSGIALSSSFWFKEPFLFSLLPWLVFFAIILLRKKQYRSLSLAVLGLATPFIIYISYFSIAGSLDEVYKTFIYNRAYTQFEALPFGAKLANSWHYYFEYLGQRVGIIPYLPLVVLPTIWFVRKKHFEFGVLLVLLAQLTLELFAVALSGLNAAHYFLPLLATICLLVIFSIHHLLGPLKFRMKLIVKGLFLGMVVNLLYNIHLPDSPYIERYQEVKEYLIEHRSEGDKLFVENAWHGSLYVIAQMTSDATIPTPLFHYFMIQDKYNHERVQTFVRSLKSKPPKYIITSKERGILKNHEELKTWFYGLYSPIEKTFDIGGDSLTLYTMSLN